jgi:hypothetical protein
MQYNLRAQRGHAAGKSLHVLCTHEALKMRWEKSPIPINRVEHEEALVAVEVVKR